MLLSTLLEKQIIENITAKTLGKLCTIHIYNNFIDYIKTDLGNIIPTQCIKSIRDAIISNKNERNCPNFQFFTLSNQQIITENGKVCGTIKDIQFSKDFKITKIITSKNNISNAVILSMSDENLVIKKITKPKLQEKHEIPNPQIITTISNYSFLIGRVLQKDLIVCGKIILKAGTKICKADVDIAVKYGKLIDLTMYSKFYNVQNL